jgi:hypothetical protein
VATFSTWMNASDPNNRQTLKSTFSITDQQLDTIFTWMVASFGPIRTAPFLVATWNLTEISDLGYLQVLFILAAHSFHSLFVQYLLNRLFRNQGFELST